MSYQYQSNNTRCQLGGLGLLDVVEACPNAVQSKKKTERGYTEDGKKKYTVVETSYGKLGGIYTGKHPKSAASKAATARFREYYAENNKQPPPLTFAIRHVAHTDTFAYKAVRKLNDKPSDTDIAYKYINIVTPLGKKV